MTKEGGLLQKEGNGGVTAAFLVNIKEDAFSKPLKDEGAIVLIGSETVNI